MAHSLSHRLRLAPVIPGAALGGHPLGLATLLSWGLHRAGLNLHQWSPRVSIGTWNLPDSAKPILLDFFSTCRLTRYLWSSAASSGVAPPPTEPHFYVLTRRKHVPEEFASAMSFIHHSWLTWINLIKHGFPSTRQLKRFTPWLWQKHSTWVRTRSQAYTSEFLRIASSSSLPQNRLLVLSTQWLF